VACNFTRVWKQANYVPVSQFSSNIKNAFDMISVQFAFFEPGVVAGAIWGKPWAWGGGYVLIL